MKVDRSLLYTNANQAVYPLREDLQLMPVYQNGTSFYLFVDSIGITPEDMMIPKDLLPILGLFNGVHTLSEIYNKHLKKSGLPLENLLQFVTRLDENRILNSPYFKAYQQEKISAFENSTIRKPSCIGSCYPESKEDLINYFDQQFNLYGQEQDESIKALYAPHIDYRVGFRTYAKGFSKIRNHKPKKVCIIGTSHNSGFYEQTYHNKPFIVSSKQFESPLGCTSLWESGYNLLSKHAGVEYGISLEDRAHEYEHSIELHAVICQYLFGSDIEVLPIIVSGLDEYMYYKDGNQGKQISKVAELLKQIDDEDIFWLISGDQTHFGRKFGDIKAAKDMISESEKFDEHYLNFACSNDFEALYNIMHETEDKLRVCGFPPLALFLSAFPNLRGNLVDRYVWNEKETESAVSFAAIAYK